MFDHYIIATEAEPLHLVSEEGSQEGSGVGSGAESGVEPQQDRGEIMQSCCLSFNVLPQPPYNM